MNGGDIRPASPGDPAPVAGYPGVPANPPDALRMLASDADRAKYADFLGDAFAEGRLTHEEYEERLAAAMSARTYGDLLPVLADLPNAGMPVPMPPATARVPATSAARDPGGWYAVGASTENSSTAVAIFGGSARKGQWVVPATTNAFAMFGGVELDLRSATFAAERCEIMAVAVMGGVEITVPVGLNVEIDGIGIFGGFDQKAEGPGVPGAPTLRIRGLAFFGGVEVKRAKRKELPAAPSS
jgi:hypothetical protein